MQHDQRHGQTPPSHWVGDACTSADPPGQVASGKQPPRLICELTSILDRLDLGELFGTGQPLEVELGSGDGTFLVDYAVRHPERNFIGVERLLGRLRKMERKGLRTGLRNLRGVRIESGYFLRYLLPPGAASALHIYFPDPRPKRKHQRHRLVSEGFPAIARGALRPGGRVYLRTDDANYFEQMQAVFGPESGLEPVPTPAELAAVQTDFEREFEQIGVSARRAAYELVPAPNPIANRPPG
jgi:tRNA (guanine-N7-)-methyltransferase